MYNQQFYIINNVLMALDAIIICITGYVAYSVSLQFPTEGLVMAFYDFIMLLVLLIFTTNYFMGRFGFYSTRRFTSTWMMIRSLLASTSFSFIVLSTGAIVLGIKPFSRVYLITHFLMAMISLGIVRVILYYYLDNRRRTTFNSRQVLLVGDEGRINVLVDGLGNQRSWGHHVVGYLNGDQKANPAISSVPCLGSTEDFDRTLYEHQIDEVIFALPKGSPLDLDKYLGKCKNIGVAARIVPAMFDVSNPSLRVETIQGIPTITDFEEIRSSSGLLYKRILDISTGIIGTLILMGIYPIVALAIKIDSPGPVFFKQRRVGRHGRHFYLYKFRSMVSGAESRKSELLVNNDTPWPIYKTEDDPRLTRVGRFLRKTSLDEFPQFINVLKGEMSIVGTRPPTPDEVKHYEDWHRRRISSKPGVTGLWQISGRKDITDFSEVVKLDLQYLDHWNFRRDLAILGKTFWIVLARKGAK